jgi:hypothetical protein
MLSVRQKSLTKAVLLTYTLAAEQGEFKNYDKKKLPTLQPMKWS